MPLWWYDPLKKRLAVGAIVLLVAALLATFYTLTTRIQPAEAARYNCVELVGADRSASQDTEAIVARWGTEVEAITDRAADCEGLVVAESVYDRPGAGILRRVGLKVDGVNRRDKERKRAKAKAETAAVLSDVMHQPAHGGTNLLSWFESVASQLEDLPGAPRSTPPCSATGSTPSRSTCAPPT